MKHGGVFLPMYQTEAMWLNFSGDYPCAVKIAAGKINAATGEDWRDDLSKTPQDYVVVPGQPWLDGFCVAKGQIRQFVAMPLGEGYTAEEQLTGKAEHGGVQIVVYPMKAKAYEKFQAERPSFMLAGEAACTSTFDDLSMGLAPGGLMRQEIYEDDYGFEVWDTGVRSRCFVHITNSLGYLAITGNRPPQEPPTARRYSSASLPWFDYYDHEKNALKGAERLAKLDSVAAKKIKKGEGPLKDNDPATPETVVKLGPNKFSVREGEF